jgi:hypothetical protein
VHQSTNQLVVGGNSYDNLFIGPNPSSLDRGVISAMKIDDSTVLWGKAELYSKIINSPVFRIVKMVSISVPYIGPGVAIL